MLPTTIVIDKAPRCVVRPTDTKDLNRFIRNGRAYLLADNPDGKITHRNADDSKSQDGVTRWRCTRPGAAPKKNFSEPRSDQGRAVPAS